MLYVLVIMSKRSLYIKHEATLYSMCILDVYACGELHIMHMYATQTHVYVFENQSIDIVHVKCTHIVASHSTLYTSTVCLNNDTTSMVKNNVANYIPTWLCLWRFCCIKSSMELASGTFGWKNIQLQTAYSPKNAHRKGECRSAIEFLFTDPVSELMH